MMYWLSDLFDKRPFHKLNSVSFMHAESAFSFRYDIQQVKILCVSEWNNCSIIINKYYYF